MTKMAKNKSATDASGWWLLAGAVGALCLLAYSVLDDGPKATGKAPEPSPTPGPGPGPTSDPVPPPPAPVPHLRARGLQKGAPVLMPGERLLVVGDETVTPITDELQKQLSGVVIDRYAKTDGSTYTQLYDALKIRPEMVPGAYDAIMVVAGYNTAHLPDPSSDLPGLQQLVTLLRKTAWRDVVLVAPLGPINDAGGQAAYEKVLVMLQTQLVGLNDLFAVLGGTSLSPVQYIKLKMDTSLLGENDLDASGVIPTATGATHAATQLADLLKTPLT